MSWEEVEEEEEEEEERTEVGMEGGTSMMRRNRTRGEQRKEESRVGGVGKRLGENASSTHL